MLHYIHRIDKNNVGDMYSVYYKFFYNNFKKYYLYINHRNTPIFNKVAKSNFVILSGVLINCDDKNSIYVHLFEIRLTFRINNEEDINKIVWLIQAKKYRENFRSKFKIRAEQSRAEQSRAEQSRAEQSSI